MDIGDVVTIFDSVESQLVRRTMLHAALDAASCQPGAEPLRMVIASGILSTRGPAELGSEHDQRVLEKPALLQILQESCDRLVDLRGEFGVVGFDF